MQANEKDAQSVKAKILLIFLIFNVISQNNYTNKSIIGIIDFFFS